MIEDVVAEALVATNALSVMTKYEGEPAVFYGGAPSDVDEKWDGCDQFPRCTFSINWTYDADRTKAGSLFIDIICRNKSTVEPEDVALALVGEMSDLFLTEGGETYAILWNRTDRFMEGGESEPQALGVTITFDMIAFPVGRVGAPDVVWSTMEWIKRQQPGLRVIGIDSMDRIWRAEDNAPACYVRMDGIATPVRPTYACTWLSANVAIHVICRGIGARQAWMRRLVDAMTLEGEIVTDDGSPFFLKQARLTASANPITTGQIIIVGEYGVLRQEPEAEPLLHVHFAREG